MPPPDIRKRTRYFVGAEGESEQSLVKWIQELSEQRGLHIHLDCHPLGGGGYSTMLNTAVVYRKRGLTKGYYKASFLLVDGDRAVTGDLSVEQLRVRAEAQGMRLCCQTPNIEGLLCRMLPGRERTVFDAATARRQLPILWPEYRKPADTRTLARKFSLEDLLRVAAVDEDVAALLRVIGMI